LLHRRKEAAEMLEALQKASQIISEIRNNIVPFILSILPLGHSFLSFFKTGFLVAKKVNLGVGSLRAVT
jgi:hypothetical protein